MNNLLTPLFTVIQQLTEIEVGVHFEVKSWVTEHGLRRQYINWWIASGIFHEHEQFPNQIDDSSKPLLGSPTKMIWIDNIDENELNDMVASLEELLEERS